METNNNINQRTNRPDRHGSNNPMWGRHHSEATRQKQSQAAQNRAAEYKKWKDSQHHITMDEFLSNNKDLDIKGYIQSLMKEDILKKIIREEINKVLCDQNG